MKKFLLVTCALLMSVTAPVMGDLASQLDTCLELECTIAPVLRKSSLDRTPERVRGSAPHMSVEESTSTNWSGYAALTSLTHPVNNAVTDVSGSWTVPHLSSTPNHAYSAFWVGIDGYSNQTVEQLGTESDWTGHAQSNYAWFEMYPGGSYEIVGFPANPGDLMGAEVKFLGNGQFQLSIVNYTRNVYTVIPSSYTNSRTALRSSAEWIVEAPYYNAILPLANYGTSHWTNCEATINGISGPINSSHWQNDALTMVTPTHTVKSLPTSLLSGGTSFSTIWEHQ